MDSAAKRILFALWLAVLVVATASASLPRASETRPAELRARTLMGPGGNESQIATTPLENRVWVFLATPSGRNIGWLGTQPTIATGYELRRVETASGRGWFLSCDPLGHAASVSLYDYASGDPVNAFDADGRFGKQSYNSISSGVSSASTSISNTFSSVKGSAQTSIYQYQIRTNTDVANMLQQKEQYVNDWAAANDVDSNLVRATILHESRGWGDAFQPVQNQLSWIKSGHEGSYGYAQLGYKPRQEAHLEIEQAETMEGSIKGAAIWLAVSQKDLKAEGIANPTNAQIASQYNSRRQLGEVGSYGKQVQWTYDQIKAGTLKNLRPQEGQ